MGINTNWLNTGQVPVNTRTGSVQLTGQFAFSAAINKLGKLLRDPDGGKALLVVADRVLRGVIRKSAVLTGRSRASWYFAEENISRLLGRSFSTTFRTTDELIGYTEGSFESSLNGPSKYIKAASSTYYIRLLEFGYSTKAPWGMVRITMQELTGTIPGDIFSQIDRLFDISGMSRFTTWRGGRGGYGGNTEQGPVGSTASVDPIE